MAIARAGRDAIDIAGETGESLAEEIANAITHGVGAAFSIAALVALVVLAAFKGTATAVVAVAIYGSTLVLLYSISTLYHAIPHAGTKRVLKVLDHCTIFLLIAGTYTPVALLALTDGPSWTLLVLIWTLAAAGIVLRIGWAGRLKKVRIALYVVMGWLALAWAGPLLDSLGQGGWWLIVGGGIAYTSGLVFYLWERMPFNHAVWHLFVMAGSTAHFLAVAYYMV